MTRVAQDIVPSLDTFLATISSDDNTSASEVDATTTKGGASGANLELEHTRLGELLLQSLLRLDVINLDGEWTDARKERKSAVRTVQDLLEKLDDGWKSRQDTLQS